MYQMVIPQLKKVEPEFGSSFVLRNFSEKLTQHKPYWHYHPELELVFIEEGSGKRHIGNHISYFNEGDLILIGSNLPHSGFSSRLSGNNQEIVLQINQVVNLPPDPLRAWIKLENVLTGNRSRNVGIQNLRLAVHEPLVGIPGNSTPEGLLGILKGITNHRNDLRGNLRSAWSRS